MRLKDFLSDRKHVEAYFVYNSNVSLESTWTNIFFTMLRQFIKPVLGHAFVYLSS